MQYLSVCSGIEASTAAWHPLGWSPWAFSQFDPDHKGKGRDFPSAVLAHHYPDVPNLGDMTKFKDWPDAALDVLVGGTPCQSFSVAGLRGGLDDERGDLMLVYCAIARKYRPRWVVWENVPGVLSDDGGRSFAGLLGLLSGSRVEVPPGGWQSAGVVDGYRGAYGLAWRVLDSQFVRVDGFGRAVPQRRRRVFVVGYLGGDWRRAAAVLFERASMSGDSPPRRGPGQSVAGGIVASSARRGGVSEGERGGLIPEASGTVTARAARSRGAANADQAALIPEVSPPLMASGSRSGGDRPPGTDGDTVHSLIPIAFGGNDTRASIDVATSCLAHHQPRLDFASETFLVEPFSFKVSHFTRGKDGAPHAAFPPLSADADKGDQDPLICQPIVFDETQITHPENRSQPRPGAPSHALAAGARPPAIAFDCKAGGKTGLNVGDVSGALHGEGHGGGRAAVMAWQNRFRGDDGRGYTRAPISMEDVTGTLDTVKPWHVATEGDRNASEDEADAISAMFLLREQIGAEAFAEWGLGVLDALQPSEVLRQAVHGGGVRRAPDESGCGVGDGTLSCPEGGAAGAVRDLREAGRQRRAPFGRGLSEQFAGEFEAALSKLPHECAQAEKIVFCLRRASEGVGLLQQALYPLQRGPAWIVRRLTPAECEKLQGFPPGFTNIPWRGKNGAPDGPRYKALGNSMSVNVMRWIGVRINKVDEICKNNIDMSSGKSRIAT